MAIKKDIVRILVVLLTVTAVFLLFDFAVGALFDKLLNKMPEEGERFAKSHFVLKQEKADIVIIGSSRALAHYDPKVFERYYQGKTVYNCGVDGQLFYYADIETNCILNRYTPKLLIWDFQINDLEKAPAENLSLLYPYYKSDNYIKSRLDGLDNTLKYKLWLNAYRYNGTAGRLLSSLRMPKTLNRKGFGGHSATDGTRKFKKKEEKVASKQLDELKVTSLIATIDRLKEKGIRTVFVISPMYNRLDGESSSVSKLTQICKDKNIQFINDSQLPDFIERENQFYDEGHLNHKGAEAFTEVLIEQINHE